MVSRRQDPALAVMSGAYKLVRRAFIPPYGRDVVPIIAVALSIIHSSERQ